MWAVESVWMRRRCSSGIVRWAACFLVCCSLVVTGEGMARSCYSNAALVVPGATCAPNPNACPDCNAYFVCPSGSYCAHAPTFACMVAGPGRAMLSKIAGLQATWVANPPNIGMREIFTVGDGSCTSCHVGGSPGSSRYTHCASCHDSNIAATVYPNWLLFNDTSNVNAVSSAYLLRNSYFQAGYTKAHASLMRAKSGSMPPGAWDADALAHSGEAVSWCDEILVKVQEWIDAGYP